MPQLQPEDVRALTLRLASCLGAVEPALAAAAASALGHIALRRPLPLPQGNLEALKQRRGPLEHPHRLVECRLRLGWMLATQSCTGGCLLAIMRRPSGSAESGSLCCRDADTKVQGDGTLCGGVLLAVSGLKFAKPRGHTASCCMQQDAVFTLKP